MFHVFPKFHVSDPHQIRITFFELSELIQTMTETVTEQTDIHKAFHSKRCYICIKLFHLIKIHLLSVINLTYSAKVLSN